MPKTGIVLAVVGSAVRDEHGWWLRQARPIAERIIRRELSKLRPDLVISGQSPKGGVDAWVEAECVLRGQRFRGYPALRHEWDGPGGYEERNIAIANACTHLLCVRDGQAKTFGAGRTAHLARQRGKMVREFVLTPLDVGRDVRAMFRTDGPAFTDPPGVWHEEILEQRPSARA